MLDAKVKVLEVETKKIKCRLCKKEVALQKSVSRMGMHYCSDICEDIARDRFEIEYHRNEEI